jgi:Tol biopolymer transport system component/DNA-binding winged helix-turn-helix (wHTH) protein
LDPARGELRRYGVRIKLQDQPFKLLVALVERPGEVVSRAELQALIWGSDTFVDFDRGLNAAMNRLRAALGDSAEQPRYIETVARRGYRFIGELEAEAEVEAEPMAAPVPGKSNGRWRGVAIAAVAAVVVAGAAYWAERDRGAGRERVSPLTAAMGTETMPAFSPDGTQVAYVWNGEKEKNADLYVKVVGTETALRLTSDGAADLFPSWSPDGKQIAFVRMGKAMGVYVVSPLGGPERKIFEWEGADQRVPGPETRIVGDLLYPMISRPSWTADGKYVVLTRNSEPPYPGDGEVVALPVDGGEPKTVAAPEAGYAYGHPTLTADGRRMAVIYCPERLRAGRKCELRVQELGEGLTPTGAATTVLQYRGQIRGIAWGPGEESLVVSGFTLPHFYLWRIPVRAGAEPERIELAGAEGMWPAVAGGAGRLAFSRSILQADLWRWELGGKPEPILSSTARDTSPMFSPDGRRVAFQSGRSGMNEIWVANADGTGERQVTKVPGRGNSSPMWSPDGKWIAYGSDSEGKEAQVWKVEVEGGAAQPWIEGPGVNWNPAWSRDGRWVYWSSNRTGNFDIWRMPAGGGAAERLTRNGGGNMQETRDGKQLIYIKKAELPGIYAMPAGGGAERQLVGDTVIRNAFDVTERGVYYITGRDEELCDLKLYEFGTGRARVVGTIERPVAFGLTVSPDERVFLYSRPVTGGDLVLIEGWR